MINWDKPIETVDGRKARLVEADIEKLQHIVYVYGKSDDVFLVDPEGYRCDDRTMGRKYSQEPFIRNARVKREGWVVKYQDQDRLLDDHIYSSEKSAVDNSPVQTRVVRIQWEE